MGEGGVVVLQFTHMWVCEGFLFLFFFKINYL